MKFNFKRFVIITLLALPVLFFCAKTEETSALDIQKDWRLGIHAYTFKKFTFFEAIDKTASLGLNWIDVGRGAYFSPEKRDIRTHYLMLTPELRNELKQKLQKEGVTLINYGVVKFTNDETECRQVFDFAKEMGIQTIVAEPEEDAFDLLEKLCDEYNINVAIHNHPKPTPYWDPNKVKQILDGRSKRLGVCGDTGHWMRSGINPVDALKMLEGRVICLHLKDLNEFGIRESHDVVWGTGVGDVKGVLEELYRQKFKGVISIEYEYNWDNNMPDVEKCIQFYNETVKDFK